MSKIKAITDTIKRKKASGIIIKSSSNIYYLSGYSGEGFAYLRACGDLSLYVDGRYSERAKKEVTCGGRDGNIKIVAVKEIYKDIVCDIMNGIKDNSRLNESENKSAVVFESNFFTYEEYIGFKKQFSATVDLIPSHNLLNKIRSVKSREELDEIKKAINIAETSMLDSLRNFCKNKKWFLELSEKDIVSLYKKSLIDKNSKESFETIVLSGENSSMPHGNPLCKKIDADNVLLCDFGAESNGYKSDETISMHLGKPSKKFLDVYDTVYSAQQIAISHIKPGVKFKYLDSVAREYIDKRGYGKYFTHSLGHGVGLDIHEYPFVYGKNIDSVKEGMVFTIEPGVYIEGEFGVRIEDMCFVNEGGAEIITGINKKSCLAKNYFK